jgi:hypothetical protein
MNSTRKFIRLGSATCIMGGLHAALFGGIYLLWIFVYSVDTEFLVTHLLDPEFSVENEAEAAQDDARELEQVVQIAFAYMAGWSALLSFVWLAVSSLIRFERPGHAANFIWIWFVLLLAGGVGAGLIFGYHLIDADLFGGGVTDLLRRDLRAPLAVAWIAGVVFAYVLCGTFFTTPKIARPAVPLASRLLRS